MFISGGVRLERSRPAEAAEAEAWPFIMAWTIKPAMPTAPTVARMKQIRRMVNHSLAPPGPLGHFGSFNALWALKYEPPKMMARSKDAATPPNIKPECIISLLQTFVKNPRPEKTAATKLWAAKSLGIVKTMSGYTGYGAYGGWGGYGYGGYGCATPCYNPCQTVCCPTPCPCPCPCPCPTTVTFTAVNATPIQVLAAGVPAAVPFPLATVPSTSYNITTGLFTAPSAGTYVFNGALTWTTAVPNTTFTAYLTLNGAPTAVTATSVQTVAGSYVVSFTGSLALTAGSVVGVSAVASTAATIFGSVAPVTFFSGSGPVC